MINKCLDLFAEDSLQRRTLSISFVFTLIIFICFFIFTIYSGIFRKKEEFQTIKITLAPLPVEQQIEKVIEKKQIVSENVLKTEENKTAKKSISTPKTSATQSVQKSTVQANSQNSSTVSAAKKSQSAAGQNAQTSSMSEKSFASTSSASASVPQAKSRFTYKKSVEDAFEAQLSSSKQVNFDENAIENAKENISQNEQSAKSYAQKSISNENALSGTAGTKSKDDLSQSNANSDLKNNSQIQTASKSTTDSLSKISSVIPRNFSVPTDIDGVSSVVKTEVSSSGSVMMKMNDGSSRMLLEPKKPYIILSEENARLIDSSRELKINFKVLASGNVNFSSISFVPSALLTESVKNEIREQIKNWRFSSASSDGIAIFDYSIIKK